MASLYTSQGALCGTFTCGDGTLCGAASDEYVLPETLTLQDDDADVRFEEEQRALQHGSIPYGEEWAARDIVLAGTVREDTAADLQALVRAIRQAAARGDQRLEVDDGSYVNVSRLRRLDVRWLEMTGRTVADLRLVLRATDPMWYSSTEGQDSQSPAGDDSWTVDTGALATVAMHPIITVTAPVGASVPSVRLTNETDDDQALLYEDLDLEDGASVVIDCKAGTVTRESTNTIRFLSGSWLRLLPGKNTIAYEGAACDIDIIWKPRWI